LGKNIVNYLLNRYIKITFKTAKNIISQMIAYKESFRKDLKERFKGRLNEDFPKPISQSPLQKKHEWFKRRYAKQA
jgi:hypothetical protein